MANFVQFLFYTAKFITSYNIIKVCQRSFILRLFSDLFTVGV